MKIEIFKTNNFWIDNGLIGLYKILESIQVKMKLIDKEFKVEFKTIDNKQLLAVELVNCNKNEDENKENLTLILNTAKNLVVENYLTFTDNAGWFYQDNNYKIYRKTDFKMHLKPFFTGKVPETQGALIVPSSTSIEIGKRDRVMDRDEYAKFNDFLEKNKSTIIESKKITLTGKGYIDSPPKYNIGSEFDMDFLSGGSKFCNFGGTTFKNADFITGMDYPFITGKSGELNFASYLESKPKISSLYSFVALFSFYNLYFQTNEKLKNYFVLYDEDMEELNVFYNVIQLNINQIKENKYCNFETYIIGTEYESEALFGFLVSIYKQIKGKLSKDKRKGLYTKSVYLFSNDGNIFRDVKLYSSISNLFELFDSFDNEDDEKFNFDQLLNMIKFFTKVIPGKITKYDTIFRNKLCNDILNFRSIVKTIEWYMGEVRLKEDKNGSIAFLDKIISVYFKFIGINMKSEMVEMCKSLGNRIGRYCRESENKGILFSIRNSKNRTEFLNILAESQFKTEISIGEEFFKELPDSPEWEEYKSLVSIFGMNSYLYKKQEQK
mgnify:CR=1 FL=1